MKGQMAKEGGTAGSKTLTCRLLATIIGAVMGSFQFGFNTGVINAPESDIKAFLNSSLSDRGLGPVSSGTVTSLWALTAAIFAVGGGAGAIAGGWTATTFGRKGGTLVNTGFGVLAAALMYFSELADSVEMLVIGRLVVGINCGLYTCLTPMYLSEISTPSTRGAISSVHQLGVVSGILGSQILGFPVILGNASGWNILLGLCLAPCIIQLLILPFCPESPRYLLITKQDEAACRRALQDLRDKDNVEDEISEIKTDVSSHQESVSIARLFTSPSLREPLLIGIVMHLSQQFCGTIGVFYYSTHLFEDAGLSESEAKYTTSAVGAILVTMTCITVPLMDGLGRRTLQLVGLGGMAVVSVLITVALTLRDQADWLEFATIAAMLTFVVFFAIGPGPVPWVIVAELFSLNARGAAVSVCVLVNWTGIFVVSFAFPYLQDALRNYTFLPFTFLLTGFFLFTYFKVPETAGKSIEEITAMWRSGDRLKSRDDAKFYGALHYGSDTEAILPEKEGKETSGSLDNPAFSHLPK